MSPVRTAEITADHIGADLIDHIKVAALVIKYHIAAPGRSDVGRIGSGQTVSLPGASSFPYARPIWQSFFPLPNP